jgi:hypothetical protein
MKQLKYKFDLDCKVAIYVPSTKNVVEQTSNEQQVLRTITELSKMFGGATATEAIGGWICSNGQIITERVTIVYSFCKSNDLANNIDDVISICERIKSEMSQEAVTLEINGQVKFI